jgi:hypothetical protein
VWQTEPSSTPLERPAQYGTRQFLTSEELAERDKGGTVAEVTEEEGGANDRLASHAGRDEKENARARPHEAALLGKEYNAWWTAGPPRKPSGNPVWNRTSLIIDPPDGRLPAYTMAALNRLEAREAARKNRSEADGPEDRNLAERCIAHELGGNSGGNFGTRQIIQAPGYVMMISDGMQQARIIPLDGRPQRDDRIRGWYGSARGRWEGDTLVVDITNINDKQDGGPIAPSHNELLPGIHQHHYFGTGATAKVTERFTRVLPNRIEYQYTLDDPSVYLKPYTILRPVEKLEDDYLMLENACHEGNYGMFSLLAGGRRHQKDAQIAADAEQKTRREQLEVLKKRTQEATSGGGRR